MNDNNMADAEYIQSLSDFPYEVGLALYAAWKTPNYGRYITRFTVEAGMVPAQLLYDFRSATGFISGTDLHDAFYGLTGEPSPSGYVLIPAGEAAKLLANWQDLFATTEAFASAVEDYTNGLGIKEAPAPKDWETMRRLLAACCPAGTPAGQFSWPGAYR